MSKKIIVIEGVSPKGHVEFNNKIIEYLDNKIEEIHIGNSVKSNYNIRKTKTFDDYFVFKGRLTHAIGFLFTVINIYRKTRTKKVDSYFLLSYDFITLFLIAIYARLAHINIIVCEHNTVPTNFIKVLIQRLSCNVSRICFLPSVARIYERIGSNVLLTKLPLPDYTNKKNMRIDETGYIFCPSASSDINRIIRVAKKNPKLKFLIKSNKTHRANNITSKPFFDNYIECMSNCLAVYIPMNNKYRVSGPLLDAVSLGKQIILPPGELFDFAIQNFPNNIVKESDLGKDIQFKNVNFDIEQYNKIIMSEINSFVSGLNEKK